MYNLINTVIKPKAIQTIGYFYFNESVMDSKNIETNKKTLFSDIKKDQESSARTINVFSLLLMVVSFIFSGITSYYLMNETRPEFLIVASLFGLNLSIFFIPKQKLFKNTDKAELWNNKSKEDFLMMSVIIFYFVCFAHIDLIT